MMLSFSGLSSVEKGVNMIDSDVIPNLMGENYREFAYRQFGYFDYRIPNSVYRILETPGGELFLSIQLEEARSR